MGNEERAVGGERKSSRGEICDGDVTVGDPDVGSGGKRRVPNAQIPVSELLVGVGVEESKLEGFVRAENRRVGSEEDGRVGGR